MQLRRPPIAENRRAEFGPVRLIFATKGLFTGPGEAIAMIKDELIDSNRNALKQGFARLGSKGFERPYIHSGQEMLWHEHDIAQFGKDAVLFAAGLASILPGDLSSGAVRLVGSAAPPRQFPSLRSALEVSPTFEPGAWIVNAFNGDTIVQADDLAAIAGYVI